jgi:hypothetical protein
MRGPSIAGWFPSKSTGSYRSHSAASTAPLRRFDLFAASGGYLEI